MTERSLITSPPDQSTWQPGTIETGPLGAEALEGREVLGNKLKPVLEKAFSEQFNFRYGEEARNHRDHGDYRTGRAVEFLTDTIHAIAESDNAESEKRETINTLLGIVVDGTHRGRVFDTTRYGSGSRQTYDADEVTMFGMGSEKAAEKIDRRIGLARLFLLNPDMANKLMDSRTIGFHGTRSGALEGILKKGLLPASDIAEQGGQIVSGEHIWNGEGQITVSLIDWHRSDWLGAYAGDETTLTLDNLDQRIRLTKDELVRCKQSGDPRAIGVESLLGILRNTKEILKSQDTPPDQKQRLADNYPVILAVDESALFKGELPLAANGDVVGEFMVGHDVPRTSIPMLLVPADRIDEVSKLCADNGLSEVKIYDLEVYRQAFMKQSAPK